MKSETCGILQTELIELKRQYHVSVGTCCVVVYTQTQGYFEPNVSVH